MSIVDKVNAETRMVFNRFFDKEPLNYLEAAGLYGVIAQGRCNIAALEVMYNHATDSNLKELVREAIDRHTKNIISQSEDFLQDSGGHLPSLAFRQRTLHKTDLNIPEDARLSDAEIAIAIGNMAKASQMALLTALHQSYQLEVALMYREMLDAGLDWDYRLLQLMLKRGWLPHLHKIEH
ncbi:DUF3231 family protein [Dendrosporobacter sp. 1207_IL3150]|uniref:DUF3231 family protein n=1 Tax=Dendrosporobacter sp. 1207_IL3150 TaxID=3084054 RepID=UPI002FD98872